MGGLSREVMEQALAIIGDSTTLTEEQTQSLLALGLTEEQIAAIQSRAQEGGGRNMGGGRQNGMAPPDNAMDPNGMPGGQDDQGASSGAMAQWLVLGGCLAAMVLGIFLAKGFRRRRN